MMTMTAAKLQWVLVRVAERLGLIGGAATLLLIAAASAYFVMLKPLINHVHQATQLASQPRQVVMPQKTEADHLQQFLKILPAVQHRAISIKSVMDIAAREKVLLDDVTYKTDNKVNDALSHTHIEFTLVGSYQEIQHFLSTVLHELHYVSVESLILNREAVQDEMIEAHIRLALHFNAAEAGDAPH